MTNTIRHHPIRVALLVALVGACLGGGRLDAQSSVRGRVVSHGRGIAGAFVQILRADSTVVGAASTNASGRFDLFTSHQGPRLLRIRAIGFRPRLLDLGDGAVTPGALNAVELEPAPFELTELVASSGARGCRAQGSDPALLRQVVDLIETTDAVIARNLVRRDLRFESELRHVEVILAGRRDSTVRESGRAITGWPVVAPPLEVLQEEGFGREKRGGEGVGRWFYGPDLSVLWSTWFLERHCFWVEPPAGEGADSVVVFRFEPTKESDLVDVEGRLEIDASRWVLKRLYYFHVNLPSWFPARSSGGMVEFAVTDAGVWYPSRWQTVAPIERARGNLSRPVLGAIIQPRPSEPGLVGYVEERGRVLEVGPPVDRDR